MWDKTFPRDRNVCYVGQKRVEFAIKGFNKVFDPVLHTNELGVGEFGFYSVDDGDDGSGLNFMAAGSPTEASKSTFKFLPLKKDGFDRYQFFYGKNDKFKIIIFIFYIKIIRFFFVSKIFKFN